jgi:BNR/Asp-box repeat
VRFSVLLAVGSVTLILAAPSDAGLIVGTQGPDLLLGTTRADRISGRAGADRIDVAGGRRDTVSCGAGTDLVAADGVDRIAPDCERISRRISSDPLSGGGAQHASQAEPDSFSWGSKIVAAFQVGRYPDGGAQAIGFAVSSDAGRTWRHGLLPRLTGASTPRGPFPRASDPAVTYDELHRVWLISTLALGFSDSALLVSRSSDGLHWSAPVTAARKPNAPDSILFDKEWIACDNGAASPFRGHCYLSYSDIEGLRLATQTSTDGGQTWSAAVGSPDGAGRRGVMGRFAPGPQPVALPTGTVVVPLYDDEISVVRSTDGGASFSAATGVAPSSFGGSPGLRAAPLPSAEVGADGTVALVWPDCVRRGCSAENDLLFSKSGDGINWTPPAVIPLGSGNHVLPGLAADPSRLGRLALAYYTEAGRKLNVGFVSSSDGGATWTRPVRLSPEGMRFNRIAQSGGAMVGDYISTSFANGRAVAVFTLAQSPLRGRLRQATYASSIAVP